MPPPITDTARRVLAPGYYTEYSKLVGDALSLQKQDLDRQRTLFAMEQDKLNAERAKTEQARDEASRAALQTVASEIAQLDPNDPDFARRRMEIVSRNPEALYNRSAASFLGVSQEALVEPQYARRMQQQQEYYTRREEEQRAAAQRKADEAFARQIALKTGRRDFFEQFKRDYGAAKTDAERDAVTGEMGWKEQQWQLERDLADAGISDLPSLKEGVPGKPGQTYYGQKADLALRAAKAKRAERDEYYRAQSLLNDLDKQLKDLTLSDEERTLIQQRRDDVNQRINVRSRGAFDLVRPQGAGTPASSKAGAKIP
jgi:hypothetical protein